MQYDILYSVLCEKANDFHLSENTCRDSLPDQTWYHVSELYAASGQGAKTASDLSVYLLPPFLVPPLQVVDLNAIHANPARPWQFAVGGSDEWARVYDMRKAATPTTPTSTSSSTGVNRGGNSWGDFWGDEGQGVGWQLQDEPVARLCPMGLRRRAGGGARGVGGGGGGKHITCVVFSELGELLATYNDDVSGYGGGVLGGRGGSWEGGGFWGGRGEGFWGGRGGGQGGLEFRG